MVTAYVSASTVPSIVDCCDSTFRINRSTEGQNVDEILRSFEEKFERNLHDMKHQFDMKCETYEKTISAISKELFETQKILNEHDSKFRNIVDAKSTIDEHDDLPQTLQFNKECLRKYHNLDTDSNTAEGSCSVVLHQSDRSPDHSSSYDDTTATPASIERLIRKELRSYMKEVLAERETQTYLLQREIEKQNQQVAQLRIDVMSRLRALDFNVKPKAPDHPIPLHCMRIEGTEVEIELIEEGKFTLGKASTSKSDPRMENQLALVHTDDPLIQFTSQICHDLIMDEAEHLMKTWGTQFDDLTIYLQDNLDKQQECIADVQKSTFEHVDAEAQKRAGILNTQLNFLNRKSQQQEKVIHKISDDQERAFLAIVETLIKLKSTLQEQVKQQEEFQSSSKQDIATFRQTLIDESKSWKSKFNQQEGQLKLLKDNLDHSLKEIEGIVEDRDSIQTILSATIELFSGKMEISNDLMCNRLATIEKRFTQQLQATQTEVQDMNEHKHEMEFVVTAICKKIVELTAGIGGTKSTAVEQILNKAVEEESAGKYYEVDQDCFKYNTLNEKKYKKALWITGKQRSKLFELDTARKE